MKINCTCGHVIVDQTDGQANKARFIPDEDWFAVLDQLDTTFENLARGRLTLAQAQHAAREEHVAHLRTIWQCSACGRVFIDDRNHQLHEFAPARGSASREALRGRPPD